MKAEIRVTDDQSHTIYIPELDETYHSTQGAVAESKHVFIGNGLKPVLEKRQEVRVLEVGFGTGLNAFLTVLECTKRQRHCMYHTIEPFPPALHLLQQLNYATDDEQRNIFNSLHQSAWNEPAQITPLFSIKKINTQLQDYVAEGKFDVVYYDAFSPAKQPELWTEECFRKMYGAMTDAGVLVTYCAKGEVRRNMQKSGFVVERLQGFGSKREMLRGKIVSRQ